MKIYYWQMERLDGSLAEGEFCFVRRWFGKVFLGEKYTLIGIFRDDI